MGLRFPADLDAWRRWQDSRHTLRRVRVALTRAAQPDAPPAAVLATRGNDPRLLVVLDSDSPTSVLALLAPLAHLGERDVAVLAPASVRAHLGAGEWLERGVGSVRGLPEVDAAETVLSLGHYLPLGAAAHAAVGRSARHVVVQHGLLTPLAPPLPPRAHLLAFSDADAAFHAHDRPDVTTTVVGSELLHRAAAEPAPPVSRFRPPVFLGQLHGAELSRASMTAAITTFCRAHGATYRPHPSETDRLSVRQHRAWERLGITIDRSAAPLATLGEPVVSIFSTGVLEAAARGVPAWVHHPRPPAWLAEFWERYGMARWGEAPTAAPPRNPDAPAARIAAWLTENA